MHFSTLLALAPFVGAAFAAPAPTPVEGALAPRTTPPSYNPVTDAVTNFKAHSLPRSDDAVVQFHVKVSKPHGNNDRIINTRCEASSSTTDGLGPFHGLCDDPTVKFAWTPSAGGWRLKVVKEYELSLGTSRFTYHDTAHHDFPASAVKTVKKGTPQEHLVISGPSDFKMQAKSRVVSAVG